MKRSYTYLKGLLTLALAALTGGLWAASESINIKFNGGSLSNDTQYGCYPVAGTNWIKTSNKSGTYTFSAGALATKLEWTAPTTWNTQNSSANALLHDFLDDNANQGTKTEITVSGLDTTAFATYDVLIYMSSDSSAANGFRAVTVNDIQYTGNGLMPAKAGSAKWGMRSDAKPEIGVNCLWVAGQKATVDSNVLKILINAVPQNDRGNGRACISAIQVIPSMGIPSADFVAPFNGSAAPMGWFTSWGDDSEIPEADDYVMTPYGQGFTVAHTAETAAGKDHPWQGHNVGQNFSVALYADISAVELNETLNANKAVVFALGAGDDSYALVKTGQNEVAILKKGAAIKKDDAQVLTVSSDSIAKGYNLFVFGSSDSKSFLYVNQTAGAEGPAFDPSNGVQVGAVFQGLKNAGYTVDAQARGAVIDEIYGWNIALDATAVTALSKRYPARLLMEREISSTTEKWGDEDWGTGVAVPTATALLDLKATGEATLTMDCNASVTELLTIKGSGTLTIAKTDGLLTASATNVSANTIATAGAATLGSVTIAPEKSLTIMDSTTTGAISGGGTLITDADVRGINFADATTALVVKSNTFTQTSALGSRAIEVRSGATFEANGIANYTPSSFKLAGTLNNNVAEGTIGDTQIRFPNIQLTGDATISGSADFGTTAGGYNNQSIFLNGHTLTKTGSNTFKLCSVTFRGTSNEDATEAGTVKIESGKLSLHGESKQSSGQYANFVVDGGVLDITGKDYEVGSLAGTSSTANVVLGNQTLAVGTLNKTTTYAGSFSGSGTLKVTSGSLKLTKKQEANITRTVDAGALVICVETGENATNYDMALPEQATVTVNKNGVLELNKGYAYISSVGEGTTKVTGDFILGIGSNYENGITNNLEIDQSCTLKIRNWHTDYVVKPASLVVNGTLTAEGYNNQSIKSFSVETSSISGMGTINVPVTLADGATLAGAVTVNGDVTVAGALNITHATKAGDTVITCANAEAVKASLPTAPAGLKYDVVEGNTIKLVVDKVTVTLPVVPNAVWKDAEGKPITSITIDPNTSTSVKLETTGDYVFANGKTSMDVTITAGDADSEATAPADASIVAAGAKIGDTPYASFAAAYADAEAGDTIKLLAGVTINSRLDIAMNVTIDLNGQTISEKVEDQFGAIYVKKGATLTIADSTTDGAITTDGGIVIGNYGTVIVNSGTIAAGDDAEADVSIYNFYYQADYYGTTTVNGGTVARIWNCGVATLAGGEVTDVDNSGAMTITDATVTNVILRNGADAAEVPGAGTLTAAEDLTVTTEEGYKAVYDSTTGTWTAIDPSIGKAAKIGDEYYTTFAAAFAAAKADDTIVLLADATITARTTIDKSITIDLNGKTIAETAEDAFGAIYVKKGATLTIAATNGGEITTDGGIVIGNYGTVIVNGGTIAAGEVAEADVSIYNFYYQADYYGTTTINGGTVARIWNCGVATLAGGTVTDVDNSGAMTIDGAEVTNVILRDGSDAAGVEGAGTLKAAEDLTVTTEEGYKAVYDSTTGTWTAIDPSIGKVAKIGDEYYDTFLGENGALAKAQAGDTITLLAPLNASEIITIEKAITIDGNKQTLTSTAGRAFNIDCAGAVTIKNLTIKAKERAINIINKAATVTLTGVTATADNNAAYIAPSAGAVTLAIDGCNFTGMAVVYVCGENAQVTIANTTITNKDDDAEYAYGAITVWSTATNATVAVTNTTITVEADSVAALNYADGAIITGVGDVTAVVAKIGDTGYTTIEEAAGDVKAGQTIVLVGDVTATTPIAIAGTIDLNGKTFQGDCLGTVKVNGGTYVTSQGYKMVGPTADYYQSSDAVFTMVDIQGSITLNAGTLTVVPAVWWTGADQTLTIAQGATFVIPAGKQMNVLCDVIANGTLTIEGTANLYSADATITAPAGLNVVTSVAGSEVKYADGVYTVVESIVLEDVIAATPAAEAIKAAMEAAGVTEIETYTITTKGADAEADADDVAAVLEVFEVTPTVDANGVLTVAYEFGISAMTNVGEVITITAGVTGAEYRAGVEVAFYADGEVIGTVTTTADSKTATITGLQAADITGKKITVKATK